MPISPCHVDNNCNILQSKPTTTSTAKDHAHNVANLNDQLKATKDKLTALKKEIKNTCKLLVKALKDKERQY